jgi:hypothetical protein
MFCSASVNWLQIIIIYIPNDYDFGYGFLPKAKNHRGLIKLLLLN